MSSKKTTTNAPAKAAAKAPAKAPAKKETAPAATAPTTMTPALKQLFKGLPTASEKFTAEQLAQLHSRYSPIKATFTEDEAKFIKGIAVPAKERLQKEFAVKAQADAEAAEAALKVPPTPAELKKLVAEMNTVMSLAPAIVAGKDDTLERINAELADLHADDFTADPAKPEKTQFSEEAVLLIRKLGFTLPGEKKAKKAKTPKEGGKASGPRARNGAPSQASLIDEALKGKGGTIPELAKISGGSESRVKGRIYYLKTTKGLNIVEKDGTYRLGK